MYGQTAGIDVVDNWVESLTSQVQSQVHRVSTSMGLVGLNFVHSASHVVGNRGFSVCAVCPEPVFGDLPDTLSKVGHRVHRGTLPYLTHQYDIDSWSSEQVYHRMNT